MAIVYNTTLKQARMGLTRDAIDGGGGSPTAGRLQIGTAGMAEILAEITLANPCGTIAGEGVLTFTLPLASTWLAGGTAAAARFIDSDDVVIASGVTVGTISANILLNSTVAVVGEPAQITSATLTHG